MSAPMTENKMGVMPVKKLLITMAVPMMASMFVQAMYNIIDSIFVSHISEDALTAVSMAYPVQNLMIGVATGTAVGVNALLARKLGEKRPDQANACALNGIFLSALSFVLFFLVGLFAARTLISIQTDNQVIIDYGTTYLHICMLASFGFFMNMMLERILQATGRTGLTVYTQLLGSIVNIILDPLLIFGIGPFPELGIAGAAIATVIGQWASFLLGLVLNLKFNHDINFSFAKFRPDLKMIKQIYIVGVPVIIMNSIGSLMTFGMNIILASFTSTATAIFGVYFKLQTFVFMPVFGINNALIPICSYNLGARNKARIVEALRFAIICAVCIMLTGLAVVQLFPTQILGLFDASDAMLAVGIPALRIISTTFVFAGFIVVCMSFFQALGHSFLGMVVSVARQIGVLLPVAYLLSFAGKLELVWLAFPIAELFAVVICAIFLVRFYRNIVVPLGEPLS